MIVDAFQFLLNEGKNLPIVPDAPKQRLTAVPDESDFLTRMGLQIIFDLKNDLFGKCKAETLFMSFGFVAQIAVFATEITGVGGFEDDDHFMNLDKILGFLEDLSVSWNLLEILN